MPAIMLCVGDAEREEAQLQDLWGEGNMQIEVLKAVVKTTQVLKRPQQAGGHYLCGE